MSDLDIPVPERPVHLGIVGLLSLIWNAVIAFDCLMILNGKEALLAKFLPQQLQ